MSDLQETDLRDAIVEIGVANQQASDEAIALMKEASNISEVTAARDNMSKEVKANNRVLTSSVQRILLDHQFSQLYGIAVYQFFSTASIDEAFGENSGMLKVLQMTDAETANLAKKAAKVRKKLKEDIEALKREAAFEIIRSLSKDKQVLFQNQFDVYDN